MLDLEYAIGLYVDTLEGTEKYGIEYFEKNLTEADYKEFVETIKYIDIYKSVRSDEKFKTLFEKLDAQKEAIYSVPAAANFKKDKSTDNAEALKKLQDIFDEEFEGE